MKFKSFVTKYFIVFLLIISYEQIAACQNESMGHWSGMMNRDGSEMNVSFEFRTQNNKFIGYFTAPSQLASGIPLDSISIKNDSLSFQLMTSPVSYFRCKVLENNIIGQIIQQGFSDGKIVLTRSKQPVNKIVQRDTSFISADHRIACRIYFPKDNTKHPAVVFIHGSGGEGMFANQYIAEYLAEKGIITLIQDKQGVGKSTGNWTTASFDDLAEDYGNAVEFLKTFQHVNEAQIGIYGHSQGGTISPLVTSKSKEISFVIAAAAIADSVYKQDIYRVENNLKSNGFDLHEIEEAMIYYIEWLNIARTGTGFEKLDSLNKVSEKEKWYDWVAAPPKEHWIWNYYLKTGNFNSLDYWKNIKVPVLLVYGQRDQIEDVNTYIKKIDGTLIVEGHNKDVTRLILPEAEHNLCIFPAQSEKFFWWHISPGYLDLISGWILYRFND